MATRYEKGDYVKHRYRNDIGHIEQILKPDSDSPNYVVQFDKQGNRSVKASKIRKIDRDELMKDIRKENNKLEGKFNKGDVVEVRAPGMGSIHGEQGTIQGRTETGHYEVNLPSGTEHLGAVDLKLINRRD